VFADSCVKLHCFGYSLLRLHAKFTGNLWATFKVIVKFQLVV